jgi:hypothetical protein
MYEDSGFMAESLMMIPEQLQGSPSKQQDPLAE